ncbi:MAG: DNA (cytosine-5-)-methyltransferase [Candidatus Theseobacter exili]|nr:DNA (cytosine-5-)-methyltransferase [Candidatus Theseobacter exili]
MNKVQNISAIDLFCGIGGLSYGLRKAGIDIKVGIDQDKSCEYAYSKNNKADFIGDDIANIQGKIINEKYWQDDQIKVLVGCAPCQPFSPHTNKVKGKEQTTKWNLLNEFLRLIEETNPQIVSMENVSNLSNKDIFKNFKSTLENLGYHVSYQNVYCPDYGIPQKRRRLVLLASKFGEINLIPKTKTPKKYKTTKDAIGHLPKLKNGEKSKSDPLHFTTELSEINIKRIEASQPNGTWLDWNEELRLECHKKSTGNTYKSVYGRMSWDEPSPTITTQFYNFGTGRFGHPEQNRALTIREAALLQTFPINYKFFKNPEDIALTKIGVHIGNAVPVDLGYIIGKSILRHLNT